MIRTAERCGSLFFFFFLNAVVPLSISFYLPLLFISRKRPCSSSQCGRTLCGAVRCLAARPIQVRGSKKRLIVDKIEKGFCDWIPMKGSRVVCFLLCSADKRIQPIVVGSRLITVWTDSMGLCLPWEKRVCVKQSEQGQARSIAAHPSITASICAASSTVSITNAQLHAKAHTHACIIHAPTLRHVRREINSGLRCVSACKARGLASGDKCRQEVYIKIGTQVCVCVCVCVCLCVMRFVASGPRPCHSPLHTTVTINSIQSLNVAPA